MNYNKKTWMATPSDTNLPGAMSRYGHASKFGAGLHCQLIRELDRPVTLHVTDVEQAQEYIKLLNHFIIMSGE